MEYVETLKFWSKVGMVVRRGWGVGRCSAGRFSTGRRNEYI